MVVLQATQAEMFTVTNKFAIVHHKKRKKNKNKHVF